MASERLAPAQLSPNTRGFHEAQSQGGASNGGARSRLQRTRVREIEVLAQQQGRIMGLLADALDESSFEAAAMAVVNRIAELFHCERVSIGVLRDRQITVHALSSTSEFERSASLVRNIARTMEEACTQACTVQYPSASEDALVTSDHAELTEASGRVSVCSVPMVADGSVFGALTLERQSAPLTDGALALVERASLLLAPIFKLKYRAELPIARRLGDLCTSIGAKVFGPRHLLFKVALIAFLVLAGAVASIDGDYEVVADASLEARDVRAVVSPARGFISKIHKRAGDLVEKGTPLAELDRRDLAVELDKWRSEFSKNAEEQHAALAARDRRQTRVLKLQEQQLLAQIRLVENLMERGELVSPVKGTVNSANPNHSYGSPVERGEVLFEIAPLTSYKLILKVDESDISDVEIGNDGRLVLSGRPYEPLKFRVTNVLPISESAFGKNRFRVEAELVDDPGWIRPGLQGVAKIFIGERRLAWIWTHGMLDALQLTWWRWGWA